MSDKTDREEMLASMYANDDIDEGPREQPMQLRLAGKATVVNINGVQIAIPRMEYVEGLEARIRKLQEENETLRQRARKLELATGKNANIAANRLSTLQSQLTSELNKKLDVRT